METQRVALSLPSEARTHVAQAPPIKWGDLDLDDEIASADGAGVDMHHHQLQEFFFSFR